MNVENVVGTGSLGREVDLEALASDLSTEYINFNPDNYHGLYIRLAEQGPLITLYRSGSYNISGANSVEDLKLTKDGLLELLYRMGVIGEALDESFEIVNVVCTAEIGHPIDLTNLAVELGLNQTEYEPEQFPGLVYRPDHGKWVILIFGSGRIVVVGADSVDTAQDAYRSLLGQINQESAKSD